VTKVKEKIINRDDKLKEEIFRSSQVSIEADQNAKGVDVKPRKLPKKLVEKLQKEVEPGIFLFIGDWEASVNGAILLLKDKDPEDKLSGLILKFRPLIEHLIEINLNPYLKLELITEEIRKLKQQPLRYSKKATDFIDESELILRQYRSEENRAPLSIESHIQNIQSLLEKAFLLFLKAEISYEGAKSQYEDPKSDDSPLSADPELNIFSGMDAHNKKSLLQRIYTTVDPEEQLLNELLLTFKPLKIPIKMRPDLLALYTNHHIQLNGPAIKKRIQRLEKPNVT